MKIYFTTGGQGYKKRVFKKIGVCMTPVKDEPQAPCPCDVSHETTQTIYLTTIKLPIDVIFNS